MQKTIGFADLQRQLRSIFDEVTREGVEYVLTRSDQPEAVIMRYDEFLELTEGRKRKEILQQALHQAKQLYEEPLGDAYNTMLASEQVLRQDWDSSEEDAAWADL